MIRKGFYKQVIKLNSRKMFVTIIDRTKVVTSHQIPKYYRSNIQRHKRDFAVQILFLIFYICYIGAFCDKFRYVLN